jgi:drug/metabolite transporter (DMT)-like permease
MNIESWFLFAIIPPVLWAIVNHIDKYLLTRHFKSGGVATLLIFSSVISIFVLPILYAFNPAITNVSGLDILILFLNGIVLAFALWVYFIALNEDDASVVVIFYQLIPVFGLIAGYFILGESITNKELLAMLLIVFGTMIISFKINPNNSIKFRTKTVVFMVTSAVLCAINSVMFKFVALEESVLLSLFWEHLGIGVFGVALFLISRKYRQEFLVMVRGNSKSVFAMNIFNEILNIGGNFIASYAYMLAPVSLVLLVNSYQQTFVLIIGIFLTLFFPFIYREDLRARVLIQKIIALVVIGIGTYFLFM